MSEPQLPNFFAIDVPEDVPTTFADMASIWHTPDTFIIDLLGLKQPPQPGQNPEGEDVLVVPFRVLHRVKIPPAQVFELMKALEQQLSAFELEKGQKPGANGYDS